MGGCSEIWGVQDRDKKEEMERKSRKTRRERETETERPLYKKNGQEAKRKRPGDGELGGVGTLERCYLPFAFLQSWAVGRGGVLGVMVWGLESRIVIHH